MTVTPSIESKEPNPFGFATFIDALRHYADHRNTESAAWCSGRTFTWSELDRAVNRMSDVLEQLGVEPGDRVLLLSTPRIEFWIGSLAIMNLGAVYVGISPQHTPREVEHIVADCRPRHVFHVSGAERGTSPAELAAIRSSHPHLEMVAALPAPDPHGPEGRTSRPLDPRQAGAVIYTSGSTGKPKGALLPHLGMTAGALSTAHAVGVESPRVLMNLPTNHLGGLVDVCGSTLVRGGFIAFDESFEASRVLRLTNELRLTNISHVPTALQAVAEHEDFGSTDLSSVEVVSWGGSAMPIGLVRKFRERGFRMKVLYGMTEITGNVTWTDDDADEYALATTVGKPNPFAEVTVRDIDGGAVEPGQDGEVLYRHPHMMIGYFGNESATQAAFTEDGFYRTGDIGRILPDGNLQLVGRRHDMYKSGGLNVYPREIEEVLEAHPAVAQAAVIGVPDPTFQEVGHAFVVLHETLDPEDLALQCRAQLAGYKVPKGFTVLEELPLLPIGKVDKKRLTALHDRLRGAEGN